MIRAFLSYGAGFLLGVLIVAILFLTSGCGKEVYYKQPDLVPPLPSTA